MSKEAGLYNRGNCCPPANAIYDPPQYIYNNHYHPQEVPIVHTIEFVNQHFCIPIPRHIVKYETKDVYCSATKNPGKLRKK